MNFCQYVKHFLSDVFAVCGCLMLVALIFWSINSIEIIQTSFLWQIITITLVYTLFKFAYVNNFDLGKKAQLISFTVCTTLADLMVVLWLYLFSPITDKNLFVIYVVIILIVKGAVYAMMYVDGQHQAKQLNEKLREYKNIYK